MTDSVTYGLGHTNTGIADGEGLVLLVWDNIDTEILAGLEFTRVGEGLISDLVEGIGTVGHKFSQEDLLVGVNCVDDQGEKLRDLSLELESFTSHDEGLFVSSENDYMLAADEKKSVVDRARLR